MCVYMWVHACLACVHVYRERWPLSSWLHNDEILSVRPGTTLSRPAQIAFYNLMRQIFFNGNPGQGHDCRDKA